MKINDAPTGGWSNWVTDEFYFADIGTPGEAVKLRLVSQTDEGGPNVDWIKVEYATGACTSPWAAGTATTSVVLSAAIKN